MPTLELTQDCSTRRDVLPITHPPQAPLNSGASITDLSEVPEAVQDAALLVANVVRGIGGDVQYRPLPNPTR